MDSMQNKRIWMKNLPRSVSCLLLGSALWFCWRQVDNKSTLHRLKPHKLETLLFKLSNCRSNYSVGPFVFLTQAEAVYWAWHNGKWNMSYIGVVLQQQPRRFIAKLDTLEEFGNESFQELNSMFEMKLVGTDLNKDCAESCRPGRSLYDLKANFVAWSSCCVQHMQKKRGTTTSHQHYWSPYFVHLWRTLLMAASLSSKLLQVLSVFLDNPEASTRHTRISILHGPWYVLHLAVVAVSDYFKGRVQCGTWLYWVLVLLVIPIVALVTVFARSYLLRKRKAKAVRVLQWLSPPCLGLSSVIIVVPYDAPSSNGNDLLSFQVWCSSTHILRAYQLSSCF